MMPKTITVTYFKYSGKYYSEGNYLTEDPHLFTILDTLIAELKAGRNPGLVEGAMKRNHFDVLVTGEDIPPHLIRAHEVCDCASCQLIQRTRKLAL